MSRITPEVMPEEAEESREDDPREQDSMEPPSKKIKNWTIQDISVPPLPEYDYQMPESMKEYAQDFLTPDVMDDIWDHIDSFQKPKNARDNITLPRRGQKAELPSVSVIQDATTMHLPIHVDMRQTCKFCSKTGQIHRSRWMCDVCNVALCLSEGRNCFRDFHKPNV